MKAIICAAMLALSISTAGAAEFVWRKPEVPKLLWQEPDLPSREPHRGTANEWVPDCKAYINDNSTAWGRADACAGVVNLLASLAQAQLGRFEEAGWGCFDVPRDVSLRQRVRVVVRYIEARPQRMDESFFRLAFEAQADAWPCRKPPDMADDRIKLLVAISLFIGASWALLWVFGAKTRRDGRSWRHV
jgi:Rap1a immunity proteins